MPASFLRSMGMLLVVASIAVSGVSMAFSARAADLPPEVAQQIGKAAEGAGANQQEASLELVVARVIRVSLSLLGILLTAYLVYGGYKWMTAGGESKEIEEAKTIIRNAVIGLAVVLLAYSISLFVVSNLLRATRNVQ